MKILRCCLFKQTGFNLFDVDWKQIKHILIGTFYFYDRRSHRGHGHVLAKGGEFKPMMAELFGKTTGYCRGRGGSMHFACVEKNILGTNGIVGEGMPIAAGVRYSIKYRGTDQIVACFMGDGACNTGAFHEGINMASVLDAPVLFVIENNQLAISVPRKWSDRLENLSQRFNPCFYGFCVFRQESCHLPTHLIPSLIQ